MSFRIFLIRDVFEKHLCLIIFDLQRKELFLFLTRITLYNLISLANFMLCLFSRSSIKGLWV